jgi:ferrochelatase
VDKAILLINVGTPDTPDVRDVKKFLLHYLNDRHVMRMPWLCRQLLVRAIIVPFRASRSAALYRQLWTKDGSPLRFYLEKVCNRLQERMKDRAEVWAAMTYGKPDIRTVMNNMAQSGYRQLTIIPLFPQYANSTTGSAEFRVIRQIANWPCKPELKIIRQFYNHPLFIDAWVDRIRAYHPEHYQQVVFSFHGLPLSHLPKTCRSEGCHCTHPVTANCYKASCFDTVNKLAVGLGLTNDKYTVTFQSRLSKHWMRPFTDDTLKKLASEKKSVLVVAPSFIADCLETSIELGVEYKKLFLENGGSDYNWVESLNDHPKWVTAVEAIAGDSIENCSGF